MGVKGAFYFGIVVMMWWIATLGSPWYMDMIQITPPGDVDPANPTATLCINVASDPNPVCTDEQIAQAQVADPEEVVECWIYGNCQVVGEQRWDRVPGTPTVTDVLYFGTSDGTSNIDDDLSSGYGAAAAMIYIAFVIYIIYWMACLYVTVQRYKDNKKNFMYGADLIPWCGKVPEDAPRGKKSTLSVFWLLALIGFLSLVFIFISIMVFGFNYDENGRRAFPPLTNPDGSTTVTLGGVDGTGDQSVTEFTQVERTFVVPYVQFVVEGTQVTDGGINSLTVIRTTTAHIGWVLALVLLVPLSASIIALPAGG